jgi:hypothetical protein
MSNRYLAGFISASYNPLLVPNAPTIGTATGGNGSASVTFTAPANVGGGAITGYTVVSTPGNITGTGTSSPVTVSGLTNGTAYTFTVFATNVYGPSSLSAASNSVTPAVGLQYLVVAGGGGAYQASTNGLSGGAGAGGLLTASNISIATGTNYTVTVGAGGSGNTNGSNSIFGSFATSIGGGRGGNVDGTTTPPPTGGSGGGGSGYQAVGGLGTSGQGFDGGSSRVTNGTNARGGGGGGGAGAVGQDLQPNTSNTPPQYAGSGGIGVSSSITGTPVYYAGGGGGGALGAVNGWNTTAGIGGLGGGGNGGQDSIAGTNGTANTGGGAGGLGATAGSLNGGSGIVILKYVDTLTITIGSGLTGSTASPSGGFKVTTITAGTGNVSWT